MLKRSYGTIKHANGIRETGKPRLFISGIGSEYNILESPTRLQPVNPTYALLDAHWSEGQVEVDQCRAMPLQIEPCFCRTITNKYCAHVRQNERLLQVLPSGKSDDSISGERITQTNHNLVGDRGIVDKHNCLLHAV